MISAQKCVILATHFSTTTKAMIKTKNTTSVASAEHNIFCSRISRNMCKTNTPNSEMCHVPFSVCILNLVNENIEANKNVQDQMFDKVCFLFGQIVKTNIVEGYFDVYSGCKLQAREAVETLYNILSTRCDDLYFCEYQGDRQ